MKNPTKAKKLKWTRGAANSLALNHYTFTCIAIFLANRSLADAWYNGILCKYAKQTVFIFRGSSAHNERLMWLAFLITLIEHAEPSLTNP